MIKACHFKKLTLHSVIIHKNPNGAPIGIVLDDFVNDSSVADHTTTETSGGAGYKAPNATGAAQSLRVRKVVNPAEKAHVASKAATEFQAGLSSSPTGSELPIQTPKPSTYSSTGFSVELSISHDGDYAMATCLMPSEAA